MGFAVSLIIAICTFLVQSSIEEEIFWRLGNISSHNFDKLVSVSKDEAVVIANLSSNGAEIASSN
jgi:hypothetical protein